MSTPFWKPWERYANRVLAEQGPEIARQAVLAALPQIREEVKREVVQSVGPDIVRASYDLNGPYPNNSPLGVAPYATPNPQKSPYPLYGFDRPWWYATPLSPTQRPGSYLNIETIRRFADTYDIARSCINHLKRELQAQKFNIVPKDSKDDSESTRRDIEDANYFFSKRGGLGDRNENRRHYELKIFEDTLVVGAFAAFKNWSKGNQLISVLPIDAATIRPVTDYYGWPGPDDDWYEQWILGMLIPNASDQTDPQKTYRHAGFTFNEIAYDGLWPVTNSPYFVSPIEYLIATVLSALKADEWNRAWLTDGNTPGQTIALPETWTPEQIREYMDYFNVMLTSDAASRQKAVGIPAGAKMQEHSRKDQDFSEFELWLARRTGAIYGVQLASIGFAGEQYKVSQENSKDSTTQFGAGSLLDLRKNHYDDILIDLGYENLEVQNGASAEESPLDRAKRLTIATGGVAWLNINDARKQDGEVTIEGADALLVPGTMKPYEQVIAEPFQVDTSKITPPDGTTGTEAQDPEDEDMDRAEDHDKDLNAWYRKSLKRVKDGKSADCEFTSYTIGYDDQATIHSGLKTAKSADDVKRIFQNIKG
jgi:hypothetical protein